MFYRIGQPAAARVVVWCLVILFGTTSAFAQTLSGRVFRVISGELLVLIDSDSTLYAVRLAGIQAPAPNQPFGADARAHLQALLLGRFVTVHYEHSDGMSPVLGKVTYGGADVNQRQIEAGLARFRSDHGLKEPLRRLYLQTEHRARAAGQGMWRDSISPAPTDWLR